MLTEAHYLNVPDNLWEQQITDRATGRPIRKQFPVPLHLDPNMESDWNYREQVGQHVVDGKIIVCHRGKGEPKDIVFVGDPTPGMLPLDDEARVITAKFSWTPTQGLEPNQQAESYTNKLLIDLSTTMEQVKATPQIPGLAEFMKSMSEIMAQQTALLGVALKNPIAAPGLAAGAEVKYDPTQHVKDEDEPLEDAEPTEAELKIASTQAVAADLAATQRAKNAAVRDTMRRS
jgi:hypothetical protein